jgi:glycosyltransferase involved in cell wall biosynthesis
MKNRLTISIAMTTYNGERFLKEQLDSFLWQTRLPDELVVCDDGSTDRTLPGENLPQPPETGLFQKF